MPLVSDILDDALNYCNAIQQGEPPNSDDQALALRVCNRMLDSWSAEKLSMVGLLRETYALTGAASYTYGPGQTFAPTARPVKIKTASVVAANGVEKECKIDTADQWAMVPDKTRTGIYVEDLLYDNGYPTGNIYVSPKPAAGNLILWTYQVIVAFTSAAETVSLAPGFEEALVTCLALKLCTPFNRPVPESLPADAAQAKQVIVQLCAEIFDAPAQPPQAPNPNSPPAQRVA